MLLQNQKMVAAFSFPGFIGVWTIMMAAMMLPSFTPIASRYVNMLESRRWLGILGVVFGYLGAWSLAGCLAYFLAQLINVLTSQWPDSVIPLAVSIFAIGGIYQFTTLKDRCLSKCRTPFAQLLEYASWKGKWRHLRVGLHHGAYCAGCCWSLMLLLFAFGTMNIGMMALVAIVTAAEKLWAQGRWFSYTVGVVCLALAIGVIWFPQLAPGLSMYTNSMNMP
jgi:predicted metal-binding membrane protein